MVNSAYCPTCGRTVYLAKSDAPVCPVCSSSLLAPQVNTYEPDAAAERIAANEARFRSINEDIKDAANAEPDGRIGFVCECGQEACTQEIRLTVEEYEELRKDPWHFGIVPGHAVPGIEETVDRRSGYDVIEKVGPPRRIVEETYPRERRNQG